MLDEAYIEYVDTGSRIGALDYINDNNIIVMRTFSKIYGLAGLRTGYGIARAEIIGYLNKVRPPFNVNSVAQAAALASLNDDGHIIASQKMNDDGKRYLYSQFDEIGLEYVRTNTNFILVDVQRPAQELYDKMLLDGVIVRSMKGYGLGGYLRVTIGTDQENARFIDVLKKRLATTP